MAKSHGDTPTGSSTVAGHPGRLVSLDAYRGLIMVVLAASGFGIAAVAENVDSAVWETLGAQFRHTKWISHDHVLAFSFWDMIQPAFIFIVGVAMPFSYAKRREAGHAFGQELRHAVGRSLILVLLGVFFFSPSWRFTNVLSQIGLGYWLVFLLLGQRWGLQLTALAAILVGTWLAFVLYPAPGPGFEPESVGVAANWFQTTGIDRSGLFAHWTKNANAFAAFDRWFLNLFPRKEPFEYHSGGYTTLNFVPSMGTMLVGVLAGQLLRSERPPGEKCRRLLLGGLLCLTLGVLAGHTVSPIVKKLWTSSWVLFSGAWVLWLLTAFYWLIDVRGWRAWTLPLGVVGMNPITMYLMQGLLADDVAAGIENLVGRSIGGGAYGPIVEAVAVLAVLWAVCGWLYWRRIFIRI